MANMLEGLTRERIRRGDDQPPYSTKAAWYNITKPRGSKGKFVSYLRNKQGYTTKRVRKARTAFMPRGYAQWKSIWKGGGFRTRPVDFVLTGQLMDNLTGRIKVQPGRLEAYLGFRTQSRSYGNISNERLRYIIDQNWRGTRAPRGLGPAFAISRDNARRVMRRAANMLAGE